jgi:oxygen-independent coproporphyrinogen-3 oxidase
LGDETLDELLRLGMNRVSFGVQSFVDAEARAVGRMHTRAICLAEIERMRAAGVQEINVDLIVGLTRQTAVSWCESVEVALGSGVPHVSVYMLEVDEDSRLGRELLKAGNREQRTGNREQGAGNRLKFGASDVPGDDAIAEWYAAACEGLEAGGVMQYEISNFARKSHASRHNVKYWRREPYVGFGLDAHSMLRACPHGPKAGEGAVRWANTDELSRYEGLRFEVQGSRFEGPEVEWIGMEKGFEEAMFLGLRMNVGVDLEELRAEFGEGLTRGAVAALTDVEQAGLVEREGSRVRLTARGRMVSNEVFSRLLVEAVV